MLLHRRCALPPMAFLGQTRCGPHPNRLMVWQSYMTPVVSHSNISETAQMYDDLRAASLNLARLYMQSALNEAAALQKEAPGLSESVLSRRTEEVGGYLRESIALAHRVNNFARGLNRECSALLHSVRQKQSSL